MTVIANTEFYQELVKRLFHPKSYFFYCVSYHIDSVLDKEGMKNEENYLLFGSLMDRLVASDDKVQELEALAQLPAFARFYDKLNAGVKYLCDYELDTEQLKIEIERLAQSMVLSALATLQNPEARKQLKEYLGVIESAEASSAEAETALSEVENQTSNGGEENSENGQADAGLPDEKPAEKTMEASPAEAVNTGPEVRAEVKEDSHDIIKLEEVVPERTEPSLEADRTLESETALESPADLEESQEKDDLVVLDPGTDASLEGFESGSTEEGGSVKMDSTPRSQSTGPRTEEAHDFEHVFRIEVETQLARLRDAVRALEEHSKENLKVCKEALELIKASAMICGYEAVEGIAAKAGAFTSACLKTPQCDLSAASSILLEAASVVETAIASTPDALDGPAVESLLRKLAAPVPVQQTATSGETRSEKPKAEPTAPPASDADPPPLAKTALEDFKLPGEDDEELLSLVDEIKHTRKLEVYGAPWTDPAGSQTSGAPKPRSNENPVAARFEKFKEEARLHFNNLDDALATLEEQSDNQVALSALESAAFALYELAMKLNLVNLGTHLESLERLIKNIISNRSKISEREHRAISDIYGCFRNLSNLKELEQPDFRKYLTAIHEIIADVELEVQGDFKLEYTNKQPIGNFEAIKRIKSTMN